jgi:hypothetical protein
LNPFGRFVCSQFVLGQVLVTTNCEELYLPARLDPAVCGLERMDSGIENPTIPRNCLILVLAFFSW